MPQAKSMRVSQERAHEIVATMKEVESVGTNAVQITRGVCDTGQTVYAIIPPFGDAIILPFAIQNNRV